MYSRPRRFPLSMVILIDNDLKKGDAKEVQDSLDAIVGGMSDLDEAFVCRFDQFFHPGKGFTSNQDQLLTELRRTKLDSHTGVMPPGGPFNGPTINGHAADGSPSVPDSTRIILSQPTKALDDAVFGAAELLKSRPRNRRKIIFIVSDGVNGGKKYNTNTYDNTVKELQGHGISVFAVGVGSAFYDRRFERLSEYAHATGGDVYYAAKKESLQDLYSRVTEEARNEYTLAYVPAGHQSREGLPRRRSAREARRADDPHAQPLLHRRNRAISMGLASASTKAIQRKIRSQPGRRNLGMKNHQGRRAFKNGSKHCRSSSIQLPLPQI